MNTRPTELPKILYHYCPAPAFVEILRSRILWLTHQAGMNDSRETTWAIPIINDEIRQLRTEETAAFFERTCDAFNPNKAELYLASFSKDDDSLSQWRAYATDGEGFAIGFHSATFAVQPQFPKWSIQPESSLGFVEIQYSDELLKKAIRTVFCLQKAISPQGGDHMTCAVTLRELAYSFKNPAFHEEQEWRIAYAPQTMPDPEKGALQIRGKLTDIRFRSARYGVLPYFEIPFGQPVRDDAIAEVVIGPKNRTNRGLLEMMLLSLGYRNAKVRRSSATYR